MNLILQACESKTSHVSIDRFVFCSDLICWNLSSHVFCTKMKSKREKEAVLLSLSARTSILLRQLVTATNYIFQNEKKLTICANSISRMIRVIDHN
jgi:hypothetical protein